MAWTPKEQNELLHGVHAGVISAFNLPEALFENTFNELWAEVERGMKVSEEKVARGIVEGFNKNINHFSGAKTADEVQTLSKATFNPDGTKKAFKEFAEVGRTIDDTYNKTWLKTEQSMAFKQAQTVDQWERTQEQKDVLPNLQYQTVNDGRVRPEHAAWDGIIKPVDDEFWDTHMTPNDWGCRCRVIRLPEGKTTDLREHTAKVNRMRAAKGEPTVKTMANSSKVFNTNPAKTKYVFKPGTSSYEKDTRAAGIKPGKDNYGLGFKK
ncbi:MAG: minor capsid protein [Gammaproteobacteria bacterium]|nr:minor capsid protein [Gammaproteobacteria bacterium]